MSNFNDFNLDPMIIKSLDEQQIVEPSEIQEKVIPIALSGKEVVAKAPTGTGKTLGYVLPIISKVDRDNNNVQALIVCPTRELVIQICDVFKATTKYYEGFRVTGLYGGQNIERQLGCLRKKPQVVVGTPGRLLDHLDRHTLKLQAVTMFVLDEGDEMFDMGFRTDIEKLMKAIPQQTAQKMLFSATIPKAIEDIVNKEFNEPEFVSATISGENIPQIKQYYTMIKDDQRVEALLYIKRTQNFSRCIVFCNTKARADKVYKALVDRHQNVEVLHGDLKQSARTRIMKNFKAGDIEMLVATDVAARGIDVDSIEVIFNFDPPSDSDFYIHRIGRTARANSTGASYTIIDPSQVSFVQAYQVATHNALEYVELPEFKDSYTLPRDGSNRFHKVERSSASKRFFLNIGKIDLLDTDTLTRLVSTKCDIDIYEIVDVKVRDTFSFVEVANSKAANVNRLQGLVIGSRKINIEEAKGETGRSSSGPKREYKAKDGFKGRSRTAKTDSDKKPYERKKKEYTPKSLNDESKYINELEIFDTEEESTKPEKKTSSRSKGSSYSSDRKRSNYGHNDKKSYSHDDRKSSYSGDRKRSSYGSDDKKSYSHDDRKSSYSGDRKRSSYGSDDKKIYSHDDKRSGGFKDKYSSKSTTRKPSGKMSGIDSPRRKNK